MALTSSNADRRMGLRRGLRYWAALVPLALVFAAPLSAQAPAAPGQPAADTQPAVKPLEDWDEKLRALQRTSWLIYSESSPLGKDARGRTAAEDLNEWFMPQAVRTQLDHARSAADQALRAGDEARARVLLDSARSQLDEQARVLTVIGMYWAGQPSLTHHRLLLEHWGADAPDLLKDSQIRLQGLQTRLTQSYSPKVSVETLGQEITALRSAYNQERIKIAATVSERQTAAGHTLATRDRSLPCPAPSPDAAAGAADHPAMPAQGVAVEEFYPPDASNDGISGAVMVSLKISAQGCMEHGEVVRSSGSPALDDAALEVAEHVSFRPAVHNGQAVDSTMRMSFTFALAGQTQDTTSGSPPTPANPQLANQARDALSAAQELSRKEDYAAAIAQLDQALAQDANNTALLLARATAHWQAQQETAARADLDHALQLEPRNLAALRLKGSLTFQAHNYQEAVATFSGILDIAPKDRYSINARVDALLAAGDYAQALTHSAETAAAFPEDAAARANYARLLRVQHRAQESEAQAAALASLEPAQRSPLLAAAGIYFTTGKQTEGMQALDKAVAVFPSDITYLTRAQARPREDHSGRLADIDAALKHVPDSLAGALLLAQDQLRSGTPAAALAALARAEGTHGEDLRFLTLRATVLLKAGQHDAAQADVNAAFTHAQTSTALNTVCWELAIRDIELQRARDACLAAVKRQPRIASFQDSLGMVLLKLGDLNGALKAYNAALQDAPLLIASRYGRALVRQRLRDPKGAAEDLDIARRIDMRIDEQFADYGLQPQP